MAQGLYAWRSRERGLYLAEFDAIAADFHLVIPAAEVFQCTVGPIAGQVAALVELCTAPAELIRHETLGGEIRPVQIP